MASEPRSLRNHAAEDCGPPREFVLSTGAGSFELKGVSGPVDLFQVESGTSSGAAPGSPDVWDISIAAMIMSKEEFESN
jgi:hypothetical protein